MEGYIFAAIFVGAAVILLIRHAVWKSEQRRALAVHDDFVAAVGRRECFISEGPPAAGYASHTRLHLTPRNLAHINAQRRLRGSSPLNERGFRAAISAAPLRSTQSSDWFTYLIMYDIFFADHTGHAPMSPITISPNEPGNGQGGAYGGAGASGGWPAPDAPTLTPSPLAGLGAGAALVGGAYLATQYGTDPLSDPNSYKGGDRPDGPLVGDGPGAANAPDPTPSYSAPARDPDPAPASSSSYDSGSSSSGGGGGGGSD